MINSKARKANSPQLAPGQGGGGGGEGLFGVMKQAGYTFDRCYLENTQHGCTPDLFVNYLNSLCNFNQQSFLPRPSPPVQIGLKI